jgi:GT2 family glycosyltransferase
MKLSIIIVNWNTKNILKQAINSVISETKEIDCELIVVDNNSSDGSSQMIKKDFPSILLIENKINKGFAGGNNDGLKITKGDYLMLLNSDTIVQENAIEKMVKFLDENNEVVMLGPKLLNKYGNFQESCRRNLPDIKNSFLYIFSINKNKYKTHKDENVSGYTEAISGAVMMFRRSVYEKIGGLDERYFMYAEDLDYCKQVFNLGWKTYYLSEAKIIHLGGESSKQKSSKNLFYFYKTMWQYYKKHFYKKNNFITNLIVYLVIKLLFIYKRFS